MNRIAINRSTPRDLVNLKNSLNSILNIVKVIKESGNENLKELIR
jgi:DNA mismatch repair ATPase MutS